MGPRVSLGNLSTFSLHSHCLVCHPGIGVTGDLSDLWVAVGLATPPPTAILRGIANLRVKKKKIVRMPRGTAQVSPQN